MHPEPDENFGWPWSFLLLVTAAAVDGARPGAWFEDQAILRQVPWRVRLVAGYCRCMTVMAPRRYRSRGHIRGASFLFRNVGRAASLAGLCNEAPVQVEGVTVVCDLADTRFPHVLAEAAGRTAEDAVLDELLRPGDTFLDVGANHGGYSLRAAQYVGASGTVFAFEPQPGLAKLIERSLSYSPVGRYEVHAVACGDRPDRGVLHVPMASSGSATLHNDSEAHVTRLEVPIERLDDLVPASGLDGRLVMKLDVEGHELSALEGAARLLTTARPPILLELSPDHAGRAGHSVTQLLCYLADLDYEIAELRSFPRAVSPHEVSRDSQRNVVALPRG